MKSLLLNAHRDTIITSARKHGATSVRLFGSFARGEETFESDIDLLVCQSALKIDPLSASKIDPPKKPKNAVFVFCSVHWGTEVSSRSFLEREWAKVLLVGAEERTLSGDYVRFRCSRFLNR